MGRDEECLHVFVRRPVRVANGVSRALWPASARRRVATGRAAQRRRSMIMSGKWWLKVLDISSMAFLCLVVVGSMLSGGALVAAVIWHLWYLLVIPAALLAALLAAVLICTDRSAPASTRRVLLPGELSSSLQLRSFSRAPSLPGSPETPMPAAPSLVRVLETFDLSRTDVEHFLGISSSDTAELPLNWHENRLTGESVPVSQLGEENEHVQAEPPLAPHEF